MTLIEEIELHIKAAGGHKKLASDIENEWRNRDRYPRPEHWTEEDEAFITGEMKKMSEQLDRSYDALYRKFYKICYKKALTKQ